jgi:hypothetical protein
VTIEAEWIARAGRIKFRVCPSELTKGALLQMLNALE